MKQIDEPDAKKRFLEALQVSMTVYRALRAAKVTRERFDKWLAEDPDFKVAFTHAQADIVDRIKEVAFIRAGLIPKKPGISTKSWHDNGLLTRIIESMDPAWRRFTKLDPEHKKSKPLEVKGLDAGQISGLIAPETAPEPMLAAKSAPATPKLLERVQQAQPEGNA